MPGAYETESPTVQFRLLPARLNLPPCWEALLSAAAENIRGKIPGAPAWV